MGIRERMLPVGWYPDSKTEIEGLVREWESLPLPIYRAVSGVAPHAGWYFCGRLIHNVIRCLDPTVETIVVTGGHDPPGGPLIAYRDDRWRTPGGLLERDAELGQWMDRSVDAVDEVGADNTVEIMIPLIQAIRPDVRWLAWRIPADIRALEFGSQLYEGSLAVGRKVAVLGSTDLTHYGPNYGFTPPESRPNPSLWAEKRDRRFIDALTTMDGAEILRLAEKDSSACSAGGAVAAMAFALSSGSDSGTLLDYTTSLEKHPGSSFVGYGAVVYPAA